MKPTAIHTGISTRPMVLVLYNLKIQTNVLPKWEYVSITVPDKHPLLLYLSKLPIAKNVNTLSLHFSQYFKNTHEFNHKIQSKANITKELHKKFPRSTPIKANTVL